MSLQFLLPDRMTREKSKSFYQLAIEIKSEYSFKLFQLKSLKKKQKNNDTFFYKNLLNLLILQIHFFLPLKFFIPYLFAIRFQFSKIAFFNKSVYFPLVSKKLEMDALLHYLFTFRRHSISRYIANTIANQIEVLYL